MKKLISGMLQIKTWKMLKCFYKASEEWLQINDKLNTLSLQEKMEIWLYRVRDALEKSMTKKQDFKLDTGEY